MNTPFAFGGPSLFSAPYGLLSTSICDLRVGALGMGERMNESALLLKCCADSSPSRIQKSAFLLPKETWRYGRAKDTKFISTMAFLSYLRTQISPFNLGSTFSYVNWNKTSSSYSQKTNTPLSCAFMWLLVILCPSLSLILNWISGI